MTRLVRAMIAACLAGAVAGGCASRTGPTAMVATGGGTAFAATPVTPAPARGPAVLLAAQNAPAAGDGETAAGEALAAEGIDPVAATPDPFEPLNRGFHGFNRTIDVVLARPVAEVYATVLPGFARRGISNALQNLEHPRYAANYILQGRPGLASEMLLRFVFNSTLGLAGLNDVAADMGLEAQPTDFGVTLAGYGVPAGTYVVTPLLGPSTTRDSIGNVVDMAFSITLYANAFTESTAIAATAGSITAVDVIETRAENDDLIDNVIQTSPDSYVTEKSIYLQRRQQRIREADPTLEGVAADDLALPDIP